MIAILKIGQSREIVVQGTEEEIGDCVKQHAMSILNGAGEGTLAVTVPLLGEPYSISDMKEPRR